MELMVFSFLAILQLISFSNGQAVNVARNQTASQLSALNWQTFLWTADKAVDNCTDSDNPDVQECCSATQGTTDNYWRVDLDMQYNVNRIVIYGRTDTNDQTSNFLLYTQATMAGTQVLTYDSTGVPYPADGVYNLQLAEVAVSSVIIKRPTENILTLCEVQVFKVCDDGKYTYDCNMTCGNCSNMQACDKVSGVCPSGCAPGWEGTMCTMVCDDGKYGNDCNMTCGNCLNMQACDKVSGVCPSGCAPGWEGTMCTMESPTSSISTMPQTMSSSASSTNTVTDTVTGTAASTGAANTGATVTTDNNNSSSSGAPNGETTANPSNSAVVACTSLFPLAVSVFVIGLFRK